MNRNDIFGLHVLSDEAAGAYRREWAASVTEDNELLNLAAQEQFASSFYAFAVFGGPLD